jgi:hypothetical protein
MARSVLKVGALLATAALLGAFSVGPGPLSYPFRGTLGECAPDRPGQWISMGSDLHNHGSSLVTIQSVSLPADARGIRMTRAWLVPNYVDPKTGNHIEGGAFGFPWPLTVKIWRTWDQRQQAAGAVIRPGEMTSLAFGVTRTSAKTSLSGGVVIVYSAGGSTWAQLSDVSFVLADTCSLTQ